MGVKTGWQGNLEKKYDPVKVYKDIISLKATDFIM